jgi:hypothetical protein
LSAPGRRLLQRRPARPPFRRLAAAATTASRKQLI